MNTKELDKQFETVNFDKSGNVIPPGSPPAAARKKRVTVADLMKLMNELEELINTDIFNWLEKLDTRVRHFENAEAEKIDTLPESVIRRFEKMEKGAATLQNDINNTLNTRLDALETAIGATVDAFRQHLEEVSGEQPAAAQEIEFAKPPTPALDQQPHGSDLAMIASVCLTMNDVLMITRALKDAQDLSDLERVEILNIACNSAGVEVTHGLQIRAGGLLGAV